MIPYPSCYFGSPKNYTGLESVFSRLPTRNSETISEGMLKTDDIAMMTSRACFLCQT
jgi:hypothetical protein